MPHKSLNSYLQERISGDASIAGAVKVIQTIASAGKKIFFDVRRAPLLGMFGETGGVNVQGEQVKKLDEISNEIFINQFKIDETVGAMISEELGKTLEIAKSKHGSEYLVTLDPLDGSSNIDVNVTIGSIFGLYHFPDSVDTRNLEIPAGKEMIASGYLLYGAACYLCFWIKGAKVAMFVFDDDSQEFLLLNDNLRIPEKSDVYSVNEANSRKWTPETQKVVDYLRSGRKESSDRYIGSLVADFHRNLLKGGVYLYPGEAKKPEGKIRLLYEAAPLGKLLEEAGGRASTGTENILDIVPKDPHQRVPTILGSKQIVEEIEKLYK